jgi:hypothetical protein
MLHNAFHKTPIIVVSIHPIFLLHEHTAERDCADYVEDAKFDRGLTQGRSSVVKL